ncbi:hypothetical protein ACM01_32665 [Streptomyces viridochromogenes]|uniref:Uncharacterized protein n=1 Tax=Streptomyces viridochromogenes TaxID=1938 RepID=A0A0J7Z321_STRVR|nr:hypothetical protein [Streptomyces viridochromogenes]KMS69997.1 hypothetical protein ACM01_32665 [Streptomyces viridochromogenes]KOG15656.1 hypothetical protein ADK36_28780 [Streptomyces viridochromogenes]KOG15707.1 hypothetical protein ADK35_28590 [Streptomyces viridochromogenes]
MTAHMPDRPATARPGTPPGIPCPSRRRQGPSPERGEFVRPLTRRQVDDRMWELGELYAHTWSSEPGEPGISDRSDRAGSAAFRRRLAGHMRRPGFELLVAEAVRPSGATDLTACAYGFPVRGIGPWWQGLDGYLPENLVRVAASGKLFAVADVVVESRVRTHDLTREWNLARRLQRRLLGDHVGALGITLVDRCDVDTYRALLAWGWRCLPAEDRGTFRFAPRRLLVLR